MEQNFALFQPAISDGTGSPGSIRDDLHFPYLLWLLGCGCRLLLCCGMVLTPCHYGRLGGRGDGERAGDSDKFPFVNTQGGKKQTVCGRKWIARAAPRFLARGSEVFLWLARTVLPVHSYRFVLYCMTTIYFFCTSVQLH